MNTYLYGMATVPFHQALLSGDDRLIEEIAPRVRRMVHLMLDHGEAYIAGENFNRTVILGLYLAAHEAGRDGPRSRPKQEPTP